MPKLSYESLSLIVGILFVIILITIMIYFSIKEKESSKKIIQLEHSIEDANKEIYKIQKWILDKDKKTALKEVDSSSVKLESRIKELCESNASLADNITSIHAGLQSDREYFEDKILLLEEKLREFRHFANQSSSTNEKQIIDLFNNNYGIDQISKELRISKGEVEFVLRLAKFKESR